MYKDISKKFDLLLENEELRQLQKKRKRKVEEEEKSKETFSSSLFNRLDREEQQIIKQLTSSIGRGRRKNLWKRFSTLFAFLFFTIVAASAINICEYKQDNNNRNEMNKQLHKTAMEMEIGYQYVLNDTVSIQDWRVGTKYLMEKMIRVNHQLGVGIDYRREPWSFLGSVYYVFTTCSTIGYGYPTPSTNGGKIFTICLYLTGVPLCFLTISALADIILIAETWLWEKFKKWCDKRGITSFVNETKIRCYIRFYAKNNQIAPQAIPTIVITAPEEEDVVLLRKALEAEKERKILDGTYIPERDDIDPEYKDAIQKVHELWDLLQSYETIYRKAPKLSVFGESKERMQLLVDTMKNHLEIDDTYHCPRKQIIGTLVLYSTLGSLWYTEHVGWKYVDAFYFMFTSMSTTGFGDFTPVEGGRLFTTGSTLFILSGIGLLARLVNDIRRKISKILNDIVDDAFEYVEVVQNRNKEEEDKEEDKNEDKNEDKKKDEDENEDEDEDDNEEKYILPAPLTPSYKAGIQYTGPKRAFMKIPLQLYFLRNISSVRKPIMEVDDEPDHICPDELFPQTEESLALPPPIKFWSCPREWRPDYQIPEYLNLECRPHPHIGPKSRERSHIMRQHRLRQSRIRKTSFESLRLTIPKYKPKKRATNSRITTFDMLPRPANARPSTGETRLDTFPDIEKVQQEKRQSAVNTNIDMPSSERDTQSTAITWHCPRQDRCVVHGTCYNVAGSMSRYNLTEPTESDSAFSHTTSIMKHQHTIGLDSGTNAPCSQGSTAGQNTVAIEKHVRIQSPTSRDIIYIRQSKPPGMVLRDVRPQVPRHGPSNSNHNNHAAQSRLYVPLLSPLPFVGQSSRRRADAPDVVIQIEEEYIPRSMRPDVVIDMPDDCPNAHDFVIDFDQL